MRIFRILSLCLLVACCVTIFCFSSQNSQTSSDTSGGITKVAISIVYPNFSELPKEQQEIIIHNITFVIRKTAHFSIFLLLGVFSYMTIVSYNYPRKPYKLAFSSVFCLLYAISDEVHQMFVPGRSGEVRDVCIDFLGALCGIFLCFALFNHLKFLKRFIGGKDA